MITISKIKIFGYKKFIDYTVSFQDGLNILVGDNNSGKSTVMEALELVLSNRVGGKYFGSSFNQKMFNVSMLSDYFTKFEADNSIEPPKIIIELFFKNIDENNSKFFELKGAKNSLGEDTEGVKLVFSVPDDLIDEFNAYVKDNLNSKIIPCEFYTIKLFSFADVPVLRLETYSIPTCSSVLEYSNLKQIHGYNSIVSGLIKNYFNDAEKIELNRKYKENKNKFLEEGISDVVSKHFEGIFNQDKYDVSTSSAINLSWTEDIILHKENIPFNYFGLGEQNILKLMSALHLNKSKDKDIILFEEIENHLSHSTLGEVIKHIKIQIDGSLDKQIILSTHSPFVLNKLGINSLVLVSNTKESMSLSSLSKDTYEYFKKLPGYDSLRYVLSNKVILVEGPSDELIIQKAFSDLQPGFLPADKGFDIISVRGLSFERFLEIGEILDKETLVLTDNDHDYNKKVSSKYSKYKKPLVYSDILNSNHTLEVSIANVPDNRVILKGILGYKKDENQEEFLTWLKSNKTEWALKVFESKQKLNYPDHIVELLKKIV